MATKYGAFEIVHALRAAIVIAYKFACFTCKTKHSIRGNAVCGNQGQVASVTEA